MRTVLICCAMVLGLSACGKTGSSSSGGPSVSMVPTFTQGCQLQCSGVLYKWPIIGQAQTDVYYCPQRAPGCFIYLGYLGQGSVPVMIKDECNAGGVVQKLSN